MNQLPKEQNMGLRMLPSMLSELETDSKYDFLREEPSFLELLKKYREKVQL